MKHMHGCIYLILELDEKFTGTAGSIKLTDGMRQGGCQISLTPDLFPFLKLRKSSSHPNAVAPLLVARQNRFDRNMRKIF
ncbi:MAG: hypothetical protein IPO68_06350 [Chitinophagaceae bacterium]|nr:hypothetical protein [Chitinophagaceae bacterium]